MVDMKTFEFMHEKDATVYIEEHPKLDPWPWLISKTTDLSDKNFMLLPDTIFGFKFKAKKWSEPAFFPSQKWHEATMRVRYVS